MTNKFPSQAIHLKNMLSNLFALPAMPQVDRFIASEFVKNKKFGSADRKWYSEQIFSIVKNLYLILYRSKYHQNEFEKFEKEINSPQDFWRAVQSIPVDTLLKTQLREKLQHPFLDSSVPLWLADYLKRRFPEEKQLKHFLNLQKTRPALWIRLNYPAKSENVLKELDAWGFQMQAFESAIALSGSKSLYQLDSFKSGYFEVQDYASQQIGIALRVKPGEYIWDVCAGGGGKTIQIASCLQNKGVVYATDIRTYKLEEVKKRAKRAQFFNVRTIPWDGNALPAFSKEINNKKGFDTILIDAPCSASGTWRRHPDAKYKVDKSHIDELSKLQLKILSITQSMSRKKIVYATCSIFKEENEDVVKKFIEQFPDFSLTNMEMIQSPNENSDFMFVAVMEKKS